MGIPYSKYTLSQYGYLGQGVRQITHCVLSCVRSWLPPQTVIIWAIEVNEFLAALFEEFEHV